jgi:enoyl-CoA hydratase/carnithine racemase
MSANNEQPGPQVTIETVGSQLILTLDHPATRNALGESAARQLIKGLRELDARPDLRVGIITGAGDIFCSGADLNDRAVHATSDVREHVPRRRSTVFDLVAQSAKPVIAAVNGPAVGAGANLALACDLRVCADEGWLQWPQARLGVLPGAGTLARLNAAVGSTLALEWTLACTRVGAAAGLAAGLYNRTCPRADLRAAALDLAAEISQSSPLSVRFIKESLSYLVQSQADTTADADGYRSFILYNSRERKEASEAWRRDQAERRGAAENGAGEAGEAGPTEASATEAGAAEPPLDGSAAPL